MKTVILNVRVPENLRDALIRESSNNDVLLSDTIRAILFNHYEDNDEEEMYDGGLFEKDFYNSNEFIYLITWIFYKKELPNDNTEKHTLIELKKIALRTIKDGSLPYHLIEEFEKVLADLLRVINDYNPQRNKFKFCSMFEDNSFNYSALSEYIAEKAFENRI